MSSITSRLAKERQTHYLFCKQILGRAGHDYDRRDLVVEALKEAADLVNYLEALGAYELMIRARDLGDDLAARPWGDHEQRG